MDTHTATNSDSQGPTCISPGPLRKYRSGEWIAAGWLARDASILAAAWRRRPSMNLSDICPMSATVPASNIHRKKISPTEVVDGSPSALPIVFVVDDDATVRESLELLAQSAGCLAETFASAEE